MNKKIIVASLSEIANELDNHGLYNEASTVTEIMVKLSQSTRVGPIGFDPKAPSVGYNQLEKPEQMRLIDTFLANARDLSNQSSQFKTPKPGEYQSKSMGWDYINNLESKLDPDVFKLLKSKWNVIAESIAKRKPKKPTL
jgi:hypothetical protein